MFEIHEYNRELLEEPGAGSISTSWEVQGKPYVCKKIRLCAFTR